MHCVSLLSSRVGKLALAMYPTKAKAGRTNCIGDATLASHTSLSRALPIRRTRQFAIDAALFSKQLYSKLKLIARHTGTCTNVSYIF
jgi:hypothetical protein